jgi:hypothetical protein
VHTTASYTLPVLIPTTYYTQHYSSQHTGTCTTVPNNTSTATTYRYQCPTILTKNTSKNKYNIYRAHYYIIHSTSTNTNNLLQVRNTHHNIPVPVQQYPTTLVPPLHTGTSATVQQQH